LDGSVASDDSVSRVYNFGDATALTAGQTGGGVDEKDTYGLIARVDAVFVKVTSQHRATNGHYLINGRTAPSTTINIQASPDLVQPFLTIGTATSDASGTFEFEDVNAASFSKRFYRASYP
jgi:hypothetical protein